MAGKRTNIPLEFTKLSTRVILACGEHPQVLRTYAIFEGLSWGAESRTIEFDGDWFEKEFGISQPTLLRQLNLLSKQPIQAILCYRSAGAGYRRFTVTLAEVETLEVVAGIKNDTVSNMRITLPVLIKESINDESIKTGSGIKNDTVSNMIPERAKPNIFGLYEANIGPLTPMIADALKDAEKDFPETWIAEAFAIACERNKRRWDYVLGILKKWKVDGFSPRSENDKRNAGNNLEANNTGQNSQQRAPASASDIAAAERIFSLQNMQ